MSTIGTATNRDIDIDAARQQLADARDLAFEQFRRLLGVSNDDARQIAEQSYLLVTTMQTYLRAAGATLRWQVRLPGYGDVDVTPDDVFGGSDVTTDGLRR